MEGIFNAKSNVFVKGGRVITNCTFPKLKRLTGFEPATSMFPTE